MKLKEKGTLPGTVETVPNQAKVIETRGGKRMQSPPQPDRGTNPSSTSIVANLPVQDGVIQIPTEEEGPSKPQAIPAARVPEPKEKGPAQPLARAPFPTRLGKKDNSKEYDKFVHTFRSLKVTIPFADALSHMPHYAKFIKDIINLKQAFPDEAAAVQLESVCSAVFKEDLPKKLSDPGSFIIIFSIGNLEPIRALCDLGANINLMPFLLFSKLGLYELEACRTVIQLADKSIRLPKGIIHDVLATAQATINVAQGKITLSLGGDKVTFSMNKALRQPQEENCDFIDELNELSTFENCMTIETLEGTSDDGSLELEAVVDSSGAVKD
ncbi:uncharacterized protein LOC127257625 [Andrographis paniculata]|uniref:uncharacterized protein LOC127257625 n=1 Tax=Andrographis paniculata TaxID=175694 RepID=UPI0021E85809|nr:uncharacterized protein LOC127257625 [Andrographis paniculata]